MLDCTPENLSAEVTASIDLRKPSISAYERIKVGYARSRQGDKPMDGTLPENPAYEYLSLMIPTIAFDNPRVRVKTRRPGRQKPVAKAMELGINRWVVDTQYRSHSVRMAYDMAMFMGASIVTETAQDRYGHGAEDEAALPTWPVVDRIPPHRFAMDPLASHWHEARWLGHMVIWDKDDLLEEAKEPDSGWDAEMVRQLAEETGLKDAGRPNDAANRAPKRGEVVCWEVWVPEYTEKGWPGPDEGFHGGIFTVVLGQAPKDGQEAQKDGKTKTSELAWVRKPRPFYGPRWGPYTVYGAYHEPDSPTPLAPLMAVAAQMEDLNDHARSVARSSTMYKRGVIIDSPDKKLINNIKSTPDGYVFSGAGVEPDNIIQFEIGGVTEQQLNQFGIVKSRLDRMLAMADAQRGAVTGKGTATENTIADEASGKRLAFLKQQFTDATARELRTIAWFMYHDDRVVFPLGEDAAQELGAPPQADLHFHGGDVTDDGGSTERGSGATFDDLELDIEPYSMEHTSEGVLQTRMLQGVQMVTELLPMVREYPEVQWRDVFAQVGDALNNPSMQDWVDFDKAQQMAAQMGAQVPGQPQQATPMMGKQAGAVGGGAAPMPSLPTQAMNKPVQASQRNTGASKTAGMSAARSAV